MYRKLVLVAILLMTMVSVNAVDVNTLFDDSNVYTGSGTVVLRWTAVDGNASNDVNVLLTYRDYTSVTEVAINNEFDRNSTNFCSDPWTLTEQICTYTWTLPQDIDNNVVVDINMYDITNAVDSNSSAMPQMDTNACFTTSTELSGTVTMDANCTGYAPASGATPTIFYNKNRVRTCGDSYVSSGDPATQSSTFGEFTVCYYSSDGVGNTEQVRNVIYTASSDAYNLALLTEVVLAALLLVVIAAALVVFRNDLTVEVMIGLVVAAVVVAISIYIFGTIL